MAKKPHLTHEANPCHATAIRKASRRLTQLYDDALAPTGLRSTQFAILAELDRRAKKPPTLAQLAKALVLDRSALGHTLRPLERDGLVVLQEDAADRRRRHIILTPAGRTRFIAARPFWLAAQRRFAAVFGQSQAAQLRATLLAIANDDRLVW